MIQIKGTTVQFKNPQVGQPTKRIPEHFYARNIMAIINGEERMFRFSPQDLAIDATEEDMIVAIENRLHEEMLKNKEIEENQHTEPEENAAE